MGDTASMVAAALVRLAPPSAVREVSWGDVRLRLSAIVDETVGLGRGLPVDALGSVRVVVTARMGDGAGVLVVRDGEDHASVLPGGRVEPGEEPVATALRELHEETGWRLDEGSLRPLGVLHLRRLDSGPPTPGFPYPDNLMLILTGTGTPPETDRWVDAEGQVHGSALVGADLALAAVAADPVETAFAHAALDCR